MGRGTTHCLPAGCSSAGTASRPFKCKCVKCLADYRSHVEDGTTVVLLRDSHATSTMIDVASSAHGQVVVTDDSGAEVRASLVASTCGSPADLEDLVVAGTASHSATTLLSRRQVDPATTDEIAPTDTSETETTASDDSPLLPTAPTLDPAEASDVPADDSMEEPPTSGPSGASVAGIILGVVPAALIILLALSSCIMRRRSIDNKTKDEWDLMDELIPENDAEMAEIGDPFHAGSTYSWESKGSTLIAVGADWDAQDRYGPGSRSSRISMFSTNRNSTFSMTSAQRSSQYDSFGSARRASHLDPNWGPSRVGSSLGSYRTPEPADEMEHGSAGYPASSLVRGPSSLGSYVYLERAPEEDTGVKQVDVVERTDRDTDESGKTLVSGETLASEGTLVSGRTELEAADAEGEDRPLMPASDDHPGLVSEPVSRVSSIPSLVPREDVPTRQVSRVRGPKSQSMRSHSLRSVTQTQ